MTKPEISPEYQAPFGTAEVGGAWAGGGWQRRRPAPARRCRWPHVCSPVDDWNCALLQWRQMAHAMVDFIADYHDNIEQFPVRSEVQPGYLRPLLPPGGQQIGRAHV